MTSRSDRRWVLNAVGGGLAALAVILSPGAAVAATPVVRLSSAPLGMNIAPWDALYANASSGNTLQTLLKNAHGVQQDMRALDGYQASHEKNRWRAGQPSRIRGKEASAVGAVGNYRAADFAHVLPGFLKQERTAKHCKVRAARKLPGIMQEMAVMHVQDQLESPARISSLNSGGEFRAVMDVHYILRPGLGEGRAQKKRNQHPAHF